MFPKISIIIPTYNSEKFIKRAIESVFNQTLQDFELIIIDDASTDNTVQIVKKIAKESDNKINIVELKSNFGGPTKPYNIGINQSKGEFVAFLEADDEWLPEKLEKEIAVFKKYENKLKLGVVFCEAFIVDEEDNTKNKLTLNYPNILLGPADFGIFFETFGRTTLSSIMIKKEVFKDVGLFDENLKIRGDIDLYFRILKKYFIYFLKEPLIKYTKLENSLCRGNDWSKFILENEYLLEKYKKDFLKHPKVKSKFLRNLGTYYLLNGDIKKSRNFLKDSIINDPLNLRLYFQYCLSFSPKIYQKTLFIKRDRK